VLHYCNGYPALLVCTAVLVSSSDVRVLIAPAERAIGSMSFILDWFSYEVKKEQQNRQETTKSFWERVQLAQETQQKEKFLSDDRNVARKYKYGHLRADPFYEQRNLMFPHKKFERRHGSQ
jgi:hypothetical protein